MFSTVSTVSTWKRQVVKKKKKKKSRPGAQFDNLTDHSVLQLNLPTTPVKLL